MGSVYADSGAHFKGMGTGSNLKSFLGSVTPTVETHIVDKRNSSSKNISNGVRCFHLVDLWNHFYEWSACGVGTPVLFPNGETVDQCFVPYLSGIQLYTITGITSQRIPVLHDGRNIGCGNWLDDCKHNNSSVTTDKVDQTKHEMTSTMTKSGDLCFEYFEVDSLHERMPLADMVYELSHDSPALTSLDSTQLSPSSWMSVLWYPIGHVPQNGQDDIDTFFLTYHGLATTKDRVPLDSKGAFNHRMVVAPFGLAMHKMDSVWISTGSDDEELAASLFDSAQSWLKKNNITHYDFNYFQNNNMVPPVEGCQAKAPDA